MSDANNEQLRPPPSWDKFEEICADLFSRIWKDNQLVRYGRAGQRQHGVDIYGKDSGVDAAVQCKGKRDWPPTKLTVPEIDAEIQEAKKFSPPLSTYIFATTADNDVYITDHVNAVSAKHAEQGLFRVTVFGWKELTRRLYDYPKLLDKHFSIYTLRKMKQELPDAIVTRVVEGLLSANLVAGSSPAHVPTGQPGPLDDRLTEALERDYAARYERLLQRSVFPELLKRNEFAPLASELLETKGAPSSGLRRKILFRASRSASIHGNLDDARRFLAEGQKLSGSEPDEIARARLAVAEDQVDEAIQLLRDRTDPDSRTVLFTILANERSDEIAIDWLAENNLAPALLSANGVLSLCHVYLRRNDLASVNRVLSQATPQQFAQLPYLYFLRGAMSFASVLPVPEQASALSGLPLDVSNASPIIGDPELSRVLDAALDDLHQALPYAKTLELQHAPQIIASYIVWCELLHPARKETALAQLRRDMEDHALAVSLIQYALAYLKGYSPAGLESYLARRDALGGLTNEELRAAFVIRLHGNDPAGLASLIASKRLQVEAILGKKEAYSVEIQALAKSGDATSASIILEDNLGRFDASQIAGLRAEIAKAQGADPVAEHLRLYESEKTPETLRALVNELVRKKDHGAVAKYAELLYEETKDPRILMLAADATMRAGDGDNFVRLVEGHPWLKDRDVGFLRHYAWQLFRLGRLGEAKEVAEKVVRDHPADRDLHLEIAVAIETGEWETLAAPLAASLEPARNLDGLSLIRAAHLAQASGQGSIMDLANAAIAKGGDDPHVLLGAYHLFVEQGLEEDRPESHEWFQKALALSGPDGPIQRFEIKELLAQQTEWNEHTRSVTEHVVRGELPLFAAGAGLRTTPVDLILRNLIRNVTSTDSRRRVALPLFAGRRLPAPVGAPASLALDITTLFVLGWLGILPLVLEAFSNIVLPGGVLAELFEGRRRIRRGQKTRLRKAMDIREAIAKGQLKVLRTPDLARDPLSEEVGVELSALIREAQVTKGIVVRPAPVNRARISDDGVADMGAHSDYLCDMHGLLKAITELNAIDEETEAAARQYFDVQDKGWPYCAAPTPEQPVFLEGLALVYLQHTKLLPAFLRTFRNVTIHGSTEDEANILIDDDQNVAQVFQIIDDIRTAIRQANAAGHVSFGPRRIDAGETESDETQSTVSLFVDFKGADVVVVDDRALNKEAFGADTAGRRARMASTLDLLEELLKRGVLSEDRYRTLRYRLREAGALLVPLTTAEVVAAAKRNRKNEAPEFRAIRDSFDLARISEIPQFPAEMRWFMTYVQAIRGAISQIWVDEPDEQRARVIASAIFEMRIVPEDWLPFWKGQPPPGWIGAVHRALIGGFALPVEILDDKKTGPYQQWLDEVLMREVRLVSPDLYKQVVSYIQEFALMPWGKSEGEGDDDDEE
ncbi:hypothetical protein AOQ73_26690 [Bradyrhizobium pachyrhizi]|uniref:HTH domain-containing protein n=1 Tax=Bradyrhizobium pachyrhizi TaxID=280333 RepID=UPI0007051CE9|nr:hypothetical protein [Bradyrhizobium pachyrhizi]KRP89212.1 hypothetical protein AOQ73_26690 [Bradyrhizobium pachyrhizi]